ncbi:hypothetical protein N866_05280 [Actinotalea ferrariae CF5-4]|uniref:Uncharacterized protein n=1 Tax=Actinotalea ferrariae CF5-4 TaxID=948458 RepID=A0A021VRV3_9CELL|nr:hypothetical protein [Actinotalea ferrariae]EYR62790.1 hypothetical protein N866_05280 [Actinotalea ferrariae CF5-4]
MADLEQARAAKARLRSELVGHHGICGIGLVRVRQGYAVRVSLASADDDDLPTDVDGVPVRVAVVGAITPQQ